MVRPGIPGRFAGRSLPSRISRARAIRPAPRATRACPALRPAGRARRGPASLRPRAGGPCARTAAPALAQRRGWGAVLEQWVVHEAGHACRAAAPPAPTPTRKGPTPRGRCSASSSSTRTPRPCSRCTRGHGPLSGGRGRAGGRHRAARPSRLGRGHRRRLPLASAPSIQRSSLPALPSSWRSRRKLRGRFSWPPGSWVLLAGRPRRPPGTSRTPRGFLPGAAPTREDTRWAGPRTVPVS